MRPPMKAPMKSQRKRSKMCEDEQSSCSPLFTNKRKSLNDNKNAHKKKRAYQKNKKNQTVKTIGEKVSGMCCHQSIAYRWSFKLFWEILIIFKINAKKIMYYIFLIDHEIQCCKSDSARQTVRQQ